MANGFSIPEKYKRFHVIVADGRQIILTEDGEVFCATPEDIQRLSTKKVMCRNVFDYALAVHLVTFVSKDSPQLRPRAVSDAANTMWYNIGVIILWIACMVLIIVITSSFGAD